MDFPLIDLPDQTACYHRLVELLHPDGLACPRCGQRDRLGVHRRHREPVLDSQCGGTASKSMPGEGSTRTRWTTRWSRPTRCIKTRGKKSIPHDDPADPPRRRANRRRGHGTFVTETNATHVYVVERGAVRTSRLVACPEGITRATVLEICARANIPHDERDLSLTELYRADEVFCSGTMGELAPVVQVDGRSIADGRPGPMTRRLSDLYRERTAAEGERVVGSE